MAEDDIPLILQDKPLFCIKYARLSMMGLQCQIIPTLLAQIENAYGFCI